MIYYNPKKGQQENDHQLVALEILIPAHYLRLQTVAKGPPKMTMSTNSQVVKPVSVPLGLSSNIFFLIGHFPKQPIWLQF
jgi:hypothetical protein